MIVNTPFLPPPRAHYSPSISPFLSARSQVVLPVAGSLIHPHPLWLASSFSDRALIEKGSDRLPREAVISQIPPLHVAPLRSFFSFLLLGI